MTEPLKAPRIEGAKIAVVLENKFVPEEIAAYLNGFPLLGGEVSSSLASPSLSRQL